MPRNLRLHYVERIGEMTNADFTLRKQIQQTQPGRIGERSEDERDFRIRILFQREYTYAYPYMLSRSCRLDGPGFMSDGAWRRHCFFWTRLFSVHQGNFSLLKKARPDSNRVASVAAQDIPMRSPPPADQGASFTPFARAASKAKKAAPFGIITSDQVAEIQNSQLAPTNSAESAIIATLPPGSYTAIVRGVNNTTGIALVEVYALP